MLGLSMAPTGMLSTARAGGTRLAPPVMQLQGGSLRTYPTFGEQLHVGISSDGRPVEADMELWQGPNNTPFSMRVRGEDGQRRPVSAMVPRGPGYTGTVALRNRGPMEFPVNTEVFADGGAFGPSAVFRCA